LEIYDRNGARIMKKVISGKLLQEKIKESIHCLCDTVGQTLGPKGNNVIIDHSLFTPFITNDGATIAKNIESEDEIVNTILEIAKEASLKTNEVIGDGTTTTLVLLKSLFNSSLKYTEKGMNPIFLKKKMDAYLREILCYLEKEKRPLDEKNMLQIAINASNDYDLGQCAYQAFQMVQNPKAITIKEVLEKQLSVQSLRGYTLDIELLSDYFLKQQTTIHFSKAKVLILHDYLDNLDNISFILNECMQTKQNLIIFVNDYNEMVLKEIVSLNLGNDLSCCLLKISEYGLHQRKLENDIEVLTHAKIIENCDLITLENLGFIENAKISQNQIRFDFQDSLSIQQYIELLKSEMMEYQDEFEIDFYQKRIAMFQNGLAEILVGASTKTESHEMKMRLEDALCALASCQEGIVLGGGITLLKIAKEIKADDEVKMIFKEALKQPFLRILDNAGLDSSQIYQEIQKKQFTKIYNVNTEQFEDAITSSVIDPFLVTKTALCNASSIATMLLTTSSLVINEHNNQLNKTNEYTEL
jgi:chaperonin GroEL